VGAIGPTITSKAERRAELGIVISCASWGKGIGTSAANVIRSYVFSTLGLAVIQAKVLRRNLAYRRLLEKDGLQLLRSIPGDPHSNTDFEDCFLFVLSSQNRTSAEQRRDIVWS
jgi:RimJ/RimL family protein N-acetyltransferase